MQFLDDLATIDRSHAGVPVTEMRLRYKRGWGVENNLIERLQARREKSWLRVSLYRLHATEHDRPVTQFEVDPLIDLEGTVPQRSHCFVVGWTDPGRGAIIRVGDLELRARGPSNPPMFGRKFGSG